MARGLAAALLAAATGVACAPDARAPRPAPARPPTSAAPARVQLELPPTAAAPWLDRSPAGKHDAIGAEEVRAYGTHAALVRTGGGWFVIDDRRGAVGPLAPPSGALWIGLGAGDRVLAALPGGALVRADILGAAPGAFRQLSEVPGAVVWDAADDVVAAGTSWDEIHVSTDGGRTFRKGSVGGNRQISGVWARGDGAVVALAHPIGGGAEVAFVSRDGARWTRSRYQPGAFARVGSWIWSGDACPVVLSRDGARWVQADVAATAAADTWLARIARTEKRAGFAPIRRITASDPPPPPPPSRGPGITGASACGAVPATDPRAIADDPTANPDDGRDIRGPYVVPSEPLWVACRGIDCLRQTPGPAPEPTASALRLLSDGVCATDHADPATGECAPGAALSSLPHAIRGGSPELLALPADCVPAGVLSARGLGLLLCGGDRTVIHAIDGARRWRQEVELDGPAAELALLLHVTMADDGTIVVSLPCREGPRSALGARSGSPCRAFARRPVGVGAADAWREVSVPGALTYRAIAGGRALAAAKRARGSLAFVLDAPGAAPRAIAVMQVPPPNIHQLAVTARGFVAITVREGRHLILYHLADDGSLLQ